MSAKTTRGHRTGAFDEEDRVREKHRRLKIRGGLQQEGAEHHEKEGRQVETAALPPPRPHHSPRVSLMREKAQEKICEN